MKLGNPSRASIEVQSIWNSVCDFVGDELPVPTWIYIFNNIYGSIETSIESIWS